jgi:PPOX class probable F420-dependent enzyme
VETIAGLPYVAMTVQLTQDVSSRLESDHYGWLTTVAKSGQPVPRLVWFYFDGTDLTVYSAPQAAKVGHIKAHPQVSLHLDSDGNGGGIIAIGGIAKIDSTDADPRDDGPYWAKYREDADKFGLTEQLEHFSTRLKITPNRVWTTPTG